MWIEVFWWIDNWWRTCIWLNKTWLMGHPFTMYHKISIKIINRFFSSHVIRNSYHSVDIFQLYQFYWWNKTTDLLHIPDHDVVSNTPRLSGIQTHNLVVIGTDCIGSCKSNYHMITPRQPLLVFEEILLINFHKDRDHLISV